jgi:prepilin signal peptidase PulO-like enzyme (type II secretory pathway)
VIEGLSTAPGWFVPVLAGYALFLAAVAIYDARQRRIPNVLVYPALGVGLVLAFVRPDGPWWSFLSAGLVAGGLLVVLALLSPGGMGMGDAKLAAAIGLMTGWPGVLVALFAGFACGATVGLLLIATGRLKRRDPMPFGPSLAAGALFAAVAGHRVAVALWPGLVA